MKPLPFYNIENIIDDWVLMGFLVGNDFIPHLPNMHINKEHNQLINQVNEKNKNKIKYYDIEKTVHLLQ